MGPRGGAGRAHARLRFVSGFKGWAGANPFEKPQPKQQPDEAALGGHFEQEAACSGQASVNRRRRTSRSRGGGCKVDTLDRDLQVARVGQYNAGQALEVSGRQKHGCGPD
jgi:hypothetical protein